MSFTIASAIEELQIQTQTVGVRISDADFVAAFNSTDEYYRAGYKMPTREREYDLLLFPGVREYAWPSDCLAMMPPRKPYDLNQVSFMHQTADELVRFNDHSYATAYKFARETPYLIANDNSGSSLTIHGCDDTDDNGTWSISGDGSSLSQDTNIYTKGSGSLRFTITHSGGTTTLTNSTITAVDLTDYLANGYAFLDLQPPSSNTTALTSVKLRLGSDASNYYELTATTRHRGDTITSGWGIIGFSFASKTTTGSPSVTAIDYVAVVITHSSSNNGTYRLDNIFVALPSYYQLPYFSNANFKSEAGAYLTKATATSDTVLCPEGTDGAYKFKALEYVAIYQLQNPLLAQFAERERVVRERSLKATYPSREVKTQSTYYRRTR